MRNRVVNTSVLVVLVAADNGVVAVAQVPLIDELALLLLLATIRWILLEQIPAHFELTGGLRDHGVVVAHEVNQINFARLLGLVDLDPLGVTKDRGGGGWR